MTRTDYPLDPEAYRVDDLFYASVTTGLDVEVIEVEVRPDPEDDDSNGPSGDVGD